MKKRNVTAFILIGVLFASIGAYFSWERLKPAASHPSAVTAFFSYSLPDATSAQQPLSQWKGKIVVVNFWATWCPPCVEEMPELVTLQKEMASRNVQIIGIGIDSASNIAEFSLKHTIDYPLYVAGINGTDLAKQFGNQTGGLPFTVLIHPNGQVTKTYLGRLNIQQLRKDLLAIHPS